MIWVPFALACFMLGVLLGGPLWIAYTLREVDRKQRLAYRRLKDLNNAKS
jgi:hypothetical protein